MYYDTTFQEAFARGLKTHPNELPAAGKQAFLLGRYLQTEYNGVFYSKAQNLGRTLCKAYDEVFEDYDVLLMPTVPKKADTFPPPNVLLDGKILIKGESCQLCQNSFRVRIIILGLLHLPYYRSTSLSFILSHTFSKLCS